MSRIETSLNLPGPLSVMSDNPEFTRQLVGLSEQVLRGDSPLSPGERELIGTYVARAANCEFCKRSHEIIAANLLEGGESTVQQALDDYESSPIREEMKALIPIALQVQQGGGDAVTDEAVEAAREAGATDQEIHDAIAVASTMVIWTNWIEGLALPAPESREQYEQIAGALTESYENALELAP